MSTLPAAKAIHPKLYRLANAGLPKLWSAGLSPPADLDKDRLFKQARRASKLDDFGPDDGWQDRLDILLHALKTEAGLNALGMTIAHGSILKALTDRLRAQHIYAQHPDIRARALAAPVIICGQMRSGTTRLQRLLACDDRFAHMRLFETLSPVPHPGKRRDPRVGFAQRGLKFMEWVNPGISIAHPTGAMEADEETGLLEHAIWGAQVEAQRRIPAFARHCETADPLPAYRTFSDLLRLISWFRGDAPVMPWLLKSPQYLQDLPALTTVMPGAKLIFMDRAPENLVASGCSMVWNHMVVQSDAVDPHWIGREWLHKTALRAARARAFRATYDPDLHIDVRFEDMNTDWRKEITRLYAFLGLDLPLQLLAKMDAYIARAARDHGFAGHRYKLSDFGLTPAAVKAALA